MILQNISRGNDNQWVIEKQLPPPPKKYSPPPPPLPFSDVIFTILIKRNKHVKVFKWTS